MTDTKSLFATSRLAQRVLLVAAFVFLVSLLPIMYSSGYKTGMADAAITSGGPMPTQNQLAVVNMYIAIGSGLIAALSAVVSALATWQKARLEFQTQKMQLQLVEMQRKMQIEEIDKLYLELEKDDKERDKRREKKKPTSIFEQIDEEK